MLTILRPRPGSLGLCLVARLFARDVCLVCQSLPQSRSCPACRYPLTGDQTTCFPRNFALEDATAHLDEQQCKARAAIKDAQHESCRMAGALKDSMAKVAKGKGIKSEMDQLYNQALNRDADLEKHLTEARNQAEAATKKLALAEAKVRNSGPLRKLQMRHSVLRISIRSTNPTGLTIIQSNIIETRPRATGRNFQRFSRSYKICSPALLRQRSSCTVKVNSLGGQLETAHQQREAAFKARHAAEEREKRLAAELRQAEGALTDGKADRQALISQHAAALWRQGQRVEALGKQLQKLQGFKKASRQEVEKLSRQLYLKKPQVAPSSHHQLHAIAQLEQKYQRQLADLAQQLASQEEVVKAAEKHAEGSEAAHEKTKAELQKQRSTFMQFRKDHEYMDDWSSKIDDYIAEHKKQLAVPKPVSVEDEAKKAVEHANGLGDKERKDFARLSACVGTLTRTLT
ncbi:TPA: hypothetical protein ACH3X3_010352 [Trebouxia sp. C0006]